MKKGAFLLAGAALVLLSSVASAQAIKIGLTGTFTGANASNGIPYRNAVELFPKKMAGQDVEWIVLDDGGDASNAMKNVRRFVDVDKVDAIVGSTSSPTALALVDLANGSQTVQIAMSPILIPENKKEFVFNLPHPAPLMISAIVADMKKNNVKKTAYIGYADGWGDLNWEAFEKQVKEAGIDVVAHERFNRNDPSVMAQVLKVLATSPDAVFIGASTTPAALPHIGLVEQDYEGLIYQTHGAVAQAFLNAGGEAVEGARLPAGPMMAAKELDDQNPMKQISLDLIEQYQAKWGNGPVPIFAGYAWDAMLVLDAAATKAIETTKPGTVDFRIALKDAMEQGHEVAGTNAIYRYSKEDHYGVDERSRILLEVKDGAFHLVQ